MDRGTLADGSQCLFAVYEAKVTWDGKPRRILVDEADTDPLVGMALLSGYELKMQVRSRGKVSIKRLPERPNHGTRREQDRQLSQALHGENPV